MIPFNLCILMIVRQFLLDSRIPVGLLRLVPSLWYTTTVDGTSTLSFRFKNHSISLSQLSIWCGPFCMVWVFESIVSYHQEHVAAPHHVSMEQPIYPNPITRVSGRQLSSLPSINGCCYCSCGDVWLRITSYVCLEIWWWYSHFQYDIPVPQNGVCVMLQLHFAE
jgi:hypothetical protein